MNHIARLCSASLSQRYQFISSLFKEIFKGTVKLLSSLKRYLTRRLNSLNFLECYAKVLLNWPSASDENNFIKLSLYFYHFAYTFIHLNKYLNYFTLEFIFRRKFSMHFSYFTMYISIWRRTWLFCGMKMILLNLIIYYT